MAILLRDVVSATGDDLLGQEHGLATLERAIAALPTPGCIALYGAWGTGKSSLLRRAHARTPAPTVWFDPWEYERRGDVLSPLLCAIMRAVEGMPKIDRGRVRSLLVGIAKTVLSLGVRAGTAFLFGGAFRPELAKLDALAGLRPEDFAENFEAWERYHDEVDAVKERFRELVDEGLKGQPESARLVVFLDDLDRCLPDNVLALIEGVKLLMCGDHACRSVFVFALDRHVVGEAIRQRFPNSTLYTGESYLEKVFDLSLEVPAVSVHQVREFITAQYGDNLELVTQIDRTLSTAKRGGLQLVAEVLGYPIFANPRVIKRVLNRLALLLSDEGRRRALQQVGNDARLERFVAWLAGAERYRSFRHFFPGASVLELSQLGDLLADPTAEPSQRAAGVLPAVAALADLPGFSAYYKLIFPALDVRAQQEPKGGLATLRDFDDLLRAAGV